MWTVDFAEPGCADPRLVGGKAHGLATMARADMPVSPGFAVTTYAYRDFLSASGLGARLEALLKGLDRGSIAALNEAAATVAGWFDDTEMADDLRACIAAGYAGLCGSCGAGNLSVAVRSSATAEDTAGTSFAGEYETFVGLRGSAQVDLHVRRCWASAFTARALGYAWKNGIDPLRVGMAVVVQKMINARVAGVMFTLNPVTGDRSRIVIEASYGLGLGVVGGEVTPDHYVVAKIEGEVLERTVGDKHVEFLGGHVPTPVDHDRRVRLCLKDADLLALARLGKRLERLQRAPQDIEFAIDADLPPGRDIVLLQCRPETVWSSGRRRASGRGMSLGLADAVLASTHGG